ncbi:MAG: 4-(cytidine 5'-diphospho)-2-C-methyl-D-erythritol kinase, partial [Rhodospirillaceae bacterium]|nr:4-(cytidine 5'-diphospho)-2-C-methyl-D-erythritol kinase [Rhodospirillaceae bacterium]
MDPIVEFAPAKLNLYLHVTGRRADGYHLLDSLMAFAGVGDTVVVSASAGGPSLVVDGPRAAEVPAGPDNLVLRAAVALAERLGRPPAVQVALTKRLPVASGIGGGSADAAAVLRALGRLWGADEADLAAVAPGLGADVPVCLASRTRAV